MVSIYYAGADWKLTNQFECVEIYDAQNCKFVMHDTAILVQDSVLEAQFIIYSAMTGTKIVCHQPEVNMGLGIRLLSHSPNQKLIACGIYDTNLVVYNNCTQTQVCELDHRATIVIDNSPDKNSNQPDIFKEELIRQDGRAQFINGDTSSLSYHYAHVTGQPTEADPSKSIVKIP